ncbi:MAG: hypothetical protein K2X81_21965 [Candidatus Obscuribacterales bacterium]|nr:hypothetical protein [Candidatus Obscuribacterales bacterium]
MTNLRAYIPFLLICLLLQSTAVFALSLDDLAPGLYSYTDPTTGKLTYYPKTPLPTICDEKPLPVEYIHLAVKANRIPALPPQNGSTISQKGTSFLRGIGKGLGKTSIGSLKLMRNAVNTYNTDVAPYHNAPPAYDPYPYGTAPISAPSMPRLSIPSAQMAPMPGPVFGSGPLFGSSGAGTVPVSGSHWVSPYIANSGQMVNGHFSTNPNGTMLDNFSSKGNVNPFTGKQGTVDPQY